MATIDQQCANADVKEVDECAQDNKYHIGQMQIKDEHLIEDVKEIRTEQKVMGKDVREIKTMIIERLPK